MASPRVLVIGCGVAGPVVACLLKKKGYQPIIFERSQIPGDIGASLMISPNGLKVLNLLGPFTERLLRNGPPMEWLLEHTAAGQELGQTDVASDFPSLYGAPAVGIKRTLIASWLRESVLEYDIELREGWVLEGIEETDDEVTAHFEGGRTETGSFLVGCDGLKATSRRLLLARRGVSDPLPTFTGLTQTAGISPTPSSFHARPGVRNWYGANMHVVCYAITHDRTSWGLTLSEGQGEEAAWGLLEAERRSLMKEHLVKKLQSQHWDPTVQGLVKNAERLIKYGIFDRSALEAGQWHSGRCVMVGDAVHPMSVHIGQGANQACEDCYELTMHIPHFDLEKPLTGAQLSAAFEAYAGKQQPHTSMLFQAARKQGGLRVVPAEACAARDALVSNAMKDRDKVQARFAPTFSRPF